MTFLNRICTICLFILLMIYNSDSNKWRTKELEDNISFPLNYSSLRKLVEPLSYKIYLNIIFEKDNATFKGDTTTFFIIEYPIKQINLSAHGLTVRKENAYLLRFPNRDIYYLRSVSYIIETETLILDFKTEIPSGFYLMYMEFIGNISRNETGLYRTTCKDCTGAPKWIFVTQLKPIAARRVFPCWDDLVLRTRFVVRIQHHPNYTSLSNMPIRKQQNIGGITWTQFKSTPPIPAYLVAFALMDFVCSTKERSDCRMWCRTRMCSTSLVKQEQMTYALEISANVTAYLQFRMRKSPQLPEITHIGLPDFSYEAEGYWGLNVYRENHLIYNETLHPIDRKLNVSMYVSSLVALQWVGNLVSPTSWTHMWFCQTLALFYGVKAFTKTHKNEDVTFLLTYRLQSLAREDHVVSQVKPVIYPADNRDEIDRLSKTSHFTNCLKEYAIIAMLEQTVTESIFQRATITYLEKHQFNTATPNDFWDILQDIMEETGYHPSIEIMVQFWLEMKSLPVITVTRNQTDHYVKIGSRPQYRITKEGDTKSIDKLWIPIYYTTKSSPNVPNFMWLLSQIDSLSIPISDLEWVIVNWQYTGYYRVQYDTQLLHIIARHLESDERTKINVLNRAHMIEDAHYFWTEEKLHIDTFLRLIYSTLYEEQCAPWYALQNIIQKMWPFLDIDVGRHAKQVIVSVLEDLLDKVGYTERSNDTECIKFKRLLATKWACRLLHTPCLEIAQKKLFEHLRDPEKCIILSMWEEWIYCNGLALSNRSIWNEVWEEYKKTGNKEILIYLACSNDITIICNYFELAILNNTIISDIFVLISEDYQNIFRSIVKKHISKNEVLDYILEKIGDEFVENLSYIIENVYSTAQIDKISLFIGKYIIAKPLFYSTLKLKIQYQILHIGKLKQLAN